jgi:amino-acid N-acetyltransferase
MKMKLRPALISDAKGIQKLVNGYAALGGMIMLSMNDIYEKIFEFIVCEAEDGSLAGACALHPMWEDLAEIRSLAVREDLSRQGIGAALVSAQLKRAAEMKFTKVFTLTYKDKFFEKSGFAVVSMDELPKKIWSDCLKCAKYPECDEIAMQREV